MTVKQLTDFAAYDQWVKKHPHGSLWQSLEWKEYQEALGRETRVYVDDENGVIRASALVVIDHTTGGLSTWDIPRGPLGMKNEELRIKNVLQTIIEDAKKEKCLSLYFSPHTILHSQFSILNSSRHEQPEATRVLDLTLSEEKLLAQMHSKGRYNIKVAQKNGVRVDQSLDTDAYYALAKKTGNRDGFGIPSQKQLETFLGHLPESFLMLAYAPDSESPIAGLIGAMWNGTGIYYYGASDHSKRNLMAPYLLQWEAMKLCKEGGCTRYDLLGIAPPNADAHHPWQGISGFKEKFGGEIFVYPPEQQIVLKPVIQIALNVKRKLFG